MGYLFTHSYLDFTPYRYPKRLFPLFQKATVIEHINESMEYFAASIARSNGTDSYNEESIIADWYEIQQFLYNFSKVSGFQYKTGPQPELMR